MRVNLFVFVKIPITANDSKPSPQKITRTRQRYNARARSRFLESLKIRNLFKGIKLLLNFFDGMCEMKNAHARYTNVMLALLLGFNF